MNVSEISVTHGFIIRLRSLSDPRSFKRIQNEPKKNFTVFFLPSFNAGRIRDVIRTPCLTRRWYQKKTHKTKQNGTKK